MSQRIVPMPLSAFDPDFMKNCDAWVSRPELDTFMKNCWTAGTASGISILMLSVMFGRRSRFRLSRWFMGRANSPRS